MLAPSPFTEIQGPLLPPLLPSSGTQLDVWGQPPPDGWEDTKSTKCLCLAPGMCTTTAEIQWLLISKALVVKIIPKAGKGKVMTP